VTRNKDTILRLYKSLVRPQLEYCIKSIPETGRLEKLQRRAKEQIWGYKDLSNEERLKRCGLTTLDRRRSRGLIEAYKIITGKEALQSSLNWHQKRQNEDTGINYSSFRKVHWGTNLLVHEL